MQRAVQCRAPYPLLCVCERTLQRQCLRCVLCLGPVAAGGFGSRPMGSALGGPRLVAGLRLVLALLAGRELRLVACLGA
eukprot:3647608-Alexandrium_andersonii.AAC.1